MRVVFLASYGIYVGLRWVRSFSQVHATIRFDDLCLMSIATKSSSKWIQEKEKRTFLSIPRHCLCINFVLRFSYSGVKCN